MSWADTNEPVTDDAVHQWLMQAEQVHNDGSGVLEGCEVTPGGTLTVDVAAGIVFVNGASQIVTALNVSVATEQGLLIAGEANFIGFYIDSAGAIQKVSGIADTGGTHIPPTLPNRTSVPIALVTIAFGDGTVSPGDIAEWRIHASQGAGFIGDTYHWREAIPEVGTPLEPSRESRWYASRYNAGSPTLEYIRARTVIDSDAANQLFWELLNSSAAKRLRVKADTGQIYNPVDAGGYYTGAGNDLRMYRDGGTSYLVNTTTGTLIIQNDAIGSNHVFIRTHGGFVVQDLDDGNVSLLNLDTTGRTLALGSAADPLVVTIANILAINNQGAGNNPIISSNAATQLLNVGASVLVTGTEGITLDHDYSWKSGTTFASILAHANTALRVFTFPDKDITVADNADLHARSHTYDSSSDHSGTLAITKIANGTNNYVLMAGASNPEWQQMGTGSDVPAFGDHSHASPTLTITEIYAAGLILNRDITGAPNDAGTTTHTERQYISIPAGAGRIEYFTPPGVGNVVITDVQAYIDGGAGADFDLEIWRQTTNSSSTQIGTTNSVVLTSSPAWYNCFASGLPYSLASNEHLSILCENTTSDSFGTFMKFLVTYEMNIS